MKIIGSLFSGLLHTEEMEEVAEAFVRATLRASPHSGLWKRENMKGVHSKIKEEKWDPGGMDLKHAFTLGLKAVCLLFGSTAS